MNRTLVLAAVAAAALGGAAVTNLAGAQSASDIVQPAPGPQVSRTISVNGSGRSAAAADRAVLTLSVVTEAPNPREALEKNNTAMTAVIAALKSLGYGVTDIQTSGLSLNAVYDHSSSIAKLVGYTANNGITLKVKDVSRLGEILDLAVSAGINRVDGLTFDVADKDAALSEARVAAMKDARAKAELMATALGAAVGRPISISESYSSPQPVAMQTMNAADSAAVPIASGQVGMEAQVSVVFELN
ncbi:MAG: SIMPL domain-containing protein [Micropepsaceae bacterium]